MSSGPSSNNSGTGSTGPSVIVPVVPANSPVVPASPACANCASLNLQLAGLSQAIQTSLGGNPLTPFNVLNVCIDLMKVLESSQNSSLTSDQKKALIIQALDTFAQNNGCPDLIQSIPSFIDLISGALNGTLTLAEAEQDTIGCCLGLCMTAQSKVAKK